jgi:hypothetical protein
MIALPMGGQRLYPTIGIFGMSGAGKTTVAATSLQPIFADTNEGTLAVDFIPELAHCRRVPVRGMSDLDTLYDYVTGTGSKDWSKKYKTIVFDHFDDIQNIILDKMSEKASDTREEPDQIELREYGIMANKLRRYLRKMKKIPITKILIMGEKPNEDGELRPSLIGQMKDQLPYFLDHTIYLRVNDKGVRYLHLNPKPGEFYAKTRARWLTPEQRKIRVDLNNYTVMTDLLAMIAAGPSKGTKKRRG